MCIMFWILRNIVGFAPFPSSLLPFFRQGLLLAQTIQGGFELKILCCGLSSGRLQAYGLYDGDFKGSQGHAIFQLFTLNSVNCQPKPFGSAQVLMVLRYLVLVIFQGQTVSARWVWKKSQFSFSRVSVPCALCSQGLTPFTLRCTQLSHISCGPHFHPAARGLWLFPLCDACGHPWLLT